MKTKINVRDWGHFPSLSDAQEGMRWVRKVRELLDIARAFGIDSAVARCRHADWQLPNESAAILNQCLSAAEHEAYFAMLSIPTLRRDVETINSGIIEARSNGQFVMTFAKIFGTRRELREALDLPEPERSARVEAFALRMREHYANALDERMRRIKELLAMPRDPTEGPHVNRDPKSAWHDVEQAAGIEPSLRGSEEALRQKMSNEPVEVLYSCDSDDIDDDDRPNIEDRRQTIIDRVRSHAVAAKVHYEAWRKAKDERSKQWKESAVLWTTDSTLQQRIDHDAKNKDLDQKCDASRETWRAAVRVFEEARADLMALIEEVEDLPRIANLGYMESREKYPEFDTGQC